MISALLGTLFERLDATTATILANGVGYQISLPAAHLAEIEDGQQVTLRVITIVREDAISLYGFVNNEDKALFLVLTTVQGVGPKAALSLLSKFGESGVRHLIVSRDDKALTKADGVGPKLAARIVQELATKVKAPEAVTAQPVVEGNPHVISQARDALAALAIPAREANRLIELAIEQDGEAADVQDLVRRALRLKGSAFR